MKALEVLEYQLQNEVLWIDQVEEAIAELKELESRSCGDCKHYIEEYTEYDNHCGRDDTWDKVEMLRCRKDFGCKFWETKND